MGENLVRVTTLEVLRKSTKVKINKEKIEELALKWNKDGLPVTVWDSQKHFRSEDEERQALYLILLDSLNFCFWNETAEKWTICYEEKDYSGYFALSLSLKRFFENHPDKANLDFFEKELDFRSFLRILSWGRGLLYLRERFEIVKIISRHLLKKYGSVRNFILSADRELSAFIPKIASELYSFDDYSPLNGQKIFFWKRAQILAMDIYGAFNGKGLGDFSDLDYPTAFPDYKLPQILNYYGILKYSPQLDFLIRNRCLIYANSREEVEIRAATIWAVEQLKEELLKRGAHYQSFKLDWILWEQSQKEKMILPHHRAKTFFY